MRESKQKKEKKKPYRFYFPFESQEAYLWYKQQLEAQSIDISLFCLNAIKNKVGAYNPNKATAGTTPTTQNA